MTEPTCNEHSGCVVRIGILECAHKNFQIKVDSIMGKMNSILGALVVSIFLLLVNLVVAVASKGI